MRKPAWLTRIVVAIVVVARFASADTDDPRHRVGAAISLGPSLMFTALGGDGRYQEK